MIPKDVRSIHRALWEKLGYGKWELLFTEPGKLVETRAQRFQRPDRYPNPQVTLIPPPDAVPSPDPDSDKNLPHRALPPGVFKANEFPEVLAVNDWTVIQEFCRLNALEEVPRFYQAGEPDRYRLNPADLKVGILIAGGPAAGLNMVTDAIVKRHFALATQAAKNAAKLTRGSSCGVSPVSPTHCLELYGYLGGYAGLDLPDRVFLAPSKSALAESSRYPGRPVSYAEPEKVWFTDLWAADAGVRLRAGRAADRGSKSTPAELAKCIDRDQLDVLYLVGGDGTIRYARAIAEELEALAPKRVVMIGGPKTMDNDINFTDGTFGFRTAVDNAIGFINTMHTAAESLDRLAVIELFGAASGFVALHAGYASGLADVVMIPELDMDEAAVVETLKKRMQRNGHAVLVVAEGALSAFKQGNAAQKQRAFGDFVDRLRSEFKIADVRPRYLMRDTPPNSFDLDLCKATGKLMVDAALSAFTQCSVHLWQGDYVLVPWSAATSRKVQPGSYYVNRLLDRERLRKAEDAAPDAGGKGQ